jgi:hypothetical protein
MEMERRKNGRQIRGKDAKWKEGDITKGRSENPEDGCGKHPVNGLDLWMALYPIIIWT